MNMCDPIVAALPLRILLFLVTRTIDVAGVAGVTVIAFDCYCAIVVNVNLS